jgi:hypothetical protein
MVYLGAFRTLFEENLMLEAFELNTKNFFLMTDAHQLKIDASSSNVCHPLIHHDQRF